MSRRSSNTPEGTVTKKLKENSASILWQQTISCMSAIYLDLILEAKVESSMSEINLSYVHMQIQIHSASTWTTLGGQYMGLKFGKVA